MKIHLNRDPVAMGDDCVSHARTVSVGERMSVADFCMSVVRPTLASVAGTVAWDVMTEDEVCLGRIHEPLDGAPYLEAPSPTAEIGSYRAEGASDLKIHCRYLSAFRLSQGGA